MHSVSAPPSKHVTFVVSGYSEFMQATLLCGMPIYMRKHMHTRWLSFSMDQHIRDRERGKVNTITAKSNTLRVSVWAVQIFGLLTKKAPLKTPLDLKLEWQACMRTCMPSSESCSHKTKVAN